MPFPNRCRWSLVAAVCVLGAPSLLFAHSFRLLLYTFEDAVYVEAATEDGQPVPDAQLTFSGADGATVGEGVTNQDGEFNMPWPVEQDGLTVLLETGDGHAATGYIERPTSPTASFASGNSDAGAPATGDIEALRSEVHELAHELEKTRAELAALRQETGGATGQRILTGLAVVFGLTGLATFLAARRSRPE